MSELDDNIEKRVLAQKILDADSLHDALEYIRKRYNVDIPVVQEHKPARSINFIQLNFYATRTDYTFTYTGI